MEVQPHRAGSVGSTGQDRSQPMNEPIKFGVGQPVTRKEDERLLRGTGRYVSDHIPANALHMGSCCGRRMPARVFASMSRRRGPCRAYASC